MGRQTQIVVIGDSVASQESHDIAFKTGKIIALSKALLITGGQGGVMEAAGKGAKSVSGTVLSITPDDSLEDAHPYSDFVIPSGIGYARNMINILAADLVVAIGGGAGTLSELAYAWQFQRNIFAYLNEGWSKIIAEKGFIDNKFDHKFDNHKFDNHNRKPFIKAISSVEDFEKQYLQWISKFR